jgi:tight adherence protein B
MSILFSDWIMVPVFGIITAFLIYLWADKVLSFLYQKSLGRRGEIMKYLKLMGSDTTEKQITLLLLFMSYGWGVLFFLLFWPKIVVGLLFGAAGIVAGWNLPFLIIRATYDRRCSRFVEQMVDGLTIMANGIKTGTAPMQAMQRVTEIMGSPIKNEFQQVISQIQFGQSMEDALIDLAERIPKPDVQMFVTAINILKETGGNMAETFETIVYVIRERQKVEKKIQALTAQGLMQGAIVSMIPFILIIVFFLIDPAFIKPMFTTTLGLVLCFVMLTLQIIGGVLIKRIVTIKV